MTNKVLSKISSILPPANLLPLLFSYMFDALAISTYWIFFSPWLENITEKYVEIAIILTIPAVLSVFGTSIFSSISDKIGRRKEFMLFSRIALMLQYILLIFFNNSILSVLVILCSFGILTQTYYIMHSALITSICHPNRKGEVSSFQTIFASGGWMIGSAVSGVIYTNLDIIGSLAFAAGFSLIAGLIVLFSPSKAWTEQKECVELVEIQEQKTDQNSSTDETDDKNISLNTSEVNKNNLTNIRILQEEEQQKPASYLEILTKPTIWKLLLVLAILDFGFGAFGIVTSIYLFEVGLNENQISMGNSIATFFGMLGLLMIGKILDRKGRKPIFIISIIGYPIFLGLMYFLSNYPIAILILYFYPAYALKVPTQNAIVSDVTKVNERARGMSLINFEYILANTPGAILICYIADKISQGILIIPIFPLVFGLIAFILSFFLIKETNKKYLEINKKNHEIIPTLK